MHGAGRVVGKGGISRKLAWLLIVLTGFGVAVYHVTLVILQYQKWPVSTLVTIEYNKELLFPAVTICNINPLRRSALSSEYLREIEQIIREKNNSNETETSTDEQQNFDEYSDDFEITKSIQQIMATMKDNARAKLGYSMDHMLLNCEFQGLPCVPGNFTRFHNGEFGNCFMFNQEPGMWSMITKTGTQYGLTLEMYAMVDEYIAEVADTVGFKILIHSQSVMPFPEDDGISISPGTSTSIGISKFQMTRAPPPYSSCAVYSDNDERTINMFSSILDTVQYSYKACDKSCYQKNVIEKCGCCDLKLPCSDEARQSLRIDESSEITYCNTTSGSIQKECTNKVFIEYLHNDLGCDELCSPSCSDVDYDTKVSSAVWPAEVVVDKVYDKVVSRRRKTNSSKLDLPENETKLQYLRKNVAKIHVYYKQLNHEHIETIPSYSWNTLLSDIGGQVGLWLGFSLLTAIEIVELVADIFMTLIKKIRCIAQVGEQKAVQSAVKF
ncbi:amiloride-sensitive sodium channel subunit gamma-like [Gigantopelta aegis]|uniref:amiloride-sensitive sodium channel subunit gamma-like n=1 Tax=Gigantopelta aegis TaxID=1735272 RepID=UPI001B8883D8|nr:amiloride-sensitive sodium channel subunit gamma-like [Gigantopelta aegis]